MSVSRETGLRWPIIGHEHVVQYLQQTLASEQLSHAYLFVGAPGIGKTAVARHFVNTLVCLNRTKAMMPVPCGQCRACVHIAHHNHPDVVWVDRIADDKTGKLKKNVSIEQVRSLENRLSLRSFLDSYKIGVIDEAERLSIEAANSLLKTLEEPPGKTLMIIMTSQLSALPLTIVSRCQVLRFKPVNTEVIEQNLRTRGVESKKAKTLAALAFGRPGIALRYIEDAELLTSFQDQYREVVSLLRADVSERLSMATKLSSWITTERIGETLHICRQVLHDAILIKSDLPLLVSNPSQAAILKETMSEWSLGRLERFADGIDTAEQYAGANVSPKSAFENLLLHY